MDDTARLRRKLQIVIREFNDGFPDADDQIRLVIGPDGAVDAELNKIAREVVAGRESGLLAHRGRDFSVEIFGMPVPHTDGWFAIEAPLPKGTLLPIDDPRLYFNLLSDHAGSVRLSVGFDDDDRLTIEAVRAVIPVSGLNADSLLELLTQLHIAAADVPARLSGKMTDPDWWAGLHGEFPIDDADDTEGDEWKQGPPDEE